MKLFYINGENVMGRWCDKPVHECPVVGYMCSFGFDVKLKDVKGGITKVLFENQYSCLSNWERGIRAIGMSNICNNCKCRSFREQVREIKLEKRK